MAVTNTDSGCEVVTCVDCGYRAVAVIVPEKGEPMPYCPECRSRQIDHGGREYPLSAFYNVNGGPETSFMCPRAATTRLFESSDDGSEEAWITAENHTDERESFVSLKDNV